MKYSDKSVPLSGWDVAYAINFGDINKAITHLSNVPQTINAQKYIINDGQFFDPSYNCFEIKADYGDWAMIGSESGVKIGALVKLKNLKIKVIKLAPATGDAFDYEYEGKKYIKLSEKLVSFDYELATTLCMNLKWYKAHEGKHELKLATGGENDVEVKSTHFIAHPAEKVDINHNDADSIRYTIAEVIEESVIDEFDHVFATIDYTREAEKAVPWLHLEEHDYAVSTTGISPTPPTDKKAAYDHYMNPDNGYAKGTLMIVGMCAMSPRNEKTKKLIVPDTIPSDLVNLIPEGCKAGYAYNHSLIIPQLIMGHLKEVFKKENDAECDLGADFEFTTVLQNKSPLKLKNQVTLNFGNSFEHHPTVDGYIAEKAMSISLQNGAISYELETKYTVQKGILGFGLPYAVDVLQRIKLVFDYEIVSGKDEEGHLIKYAALKQREAPDIKGSVYPHYEESHQTFGDILLKFGETLVENLLIMGLTLGLMKLGSLAGRGLVKGAKASVRLAAESEMIMIGSKEASSIAFAEKNATKIAELEKSHSVILKDTEESLVESKKAGKTELSKTGQSLIWEIVKFTFWQTVVTKGLETYEQFKVSQLEELKMHEEFCKTIHAGMCHIDWSNQEHNSRFVIKEGGLTNGSFVVGLDLDFKHETQK